MRDIKFRNWIKEVRDGDTGDTVYPGYMNYDPLWQDIKAVRIEKKEVETSTMVDMIKPHIAKVNDIFKYPHTLMQFTGLLDKSGKEIYEGDICRKFSFVKPANDYSDGKLFKVHWDENGCGWNIRRPSPRISKWEYEVIGNIWENPELLK